MSGYVWNQIYARKSQNKTKNDYIFINGLGFVSYEYYLDYLKKIPNIIKRR